MNRKIASTPGTGQTLSSAMLRGWTPSSSQVHRWVRDTLSGVLSHRDLAERVRRLWEFDEIVYAGRPAAEWYLALLCHVGDEAGLRDDGFLQAMRRVVDGAD